MDRQRFGLSLPELGLEGSLRVQGGVTGTVASYLRYLVDRYFDDPEIDEVDQLLFAFGVHNAGPARMRRVRAKALGLGYDPNQWFRYVERVIAAEVGREPVR